MTISFNAIPGLQVGHAQNLDAITGCTVVLTPNGATAGVDQRGGAPGTRETDLLRPMHLVEQVHAVLLTGGSAFGLAAADGVARWLEEQQLGFEAGPTRVPIVPAAVLFDLTIGRANIRPDAHMGYEACQNAVAATGPLPLGSVGAGIGATVGNILGPPARMKGGIGAAVIEVLPDVFVGALIAVNCFGDVIDPHTCRILAGVRKLPDGGFADTMQLLTQIPSEPAGLGNTVIGVVATNATLPKEMVNKMAQMAHNGLARTIRPAHTMFDGDTIFALATGQGPTGNVNLIGAYAAEAAAQAVLAAVKEAKSLGDTPALADFS